MKALGYLIFAATLSTGIGHAQNRYQAEQELQAEEAIREGRFTELRDLTDQIAIYKACNAYRGADITLCSSVAAIYQKQRFATAGTQRQQRVRSDANEAAAAREAMTSDVEREAYDACMNKPLRGIQRHNPGDCRIEAHRTAQEQQRNEAVRARVKAEEDARNAENEARWAQEKQAADRLSACEQQFKAQLQLHQAAADIIEAVSTQKLSQQLMEQYKEKERETGVVTEADAHAREQLWESNKLMQMGLPQRFAEYKAFGGTAESPEEVTRLPDPCAALRPEGARN